MTMSQRMLNLLLHMCCNNTAFINHTKNQSSNPEENIEIESSSPDEQAFISGCYALGYKFMGRDLETNMITIEDLLNSMISPPSFMKSRKNIPSGNALHV